jgi:hypothetical protein
MTNTKQGQTIPFTDGIPRCTTCSRAGHLPGTFAGHWFTVNAAVGDVVLVSPAAGGSRYLALVANTEDFDGNVLVWDRGWGYPTVDDLGSFDRALRVISPADITRKTGALATMHSDDLIRAEYGSRDFEVMAPLNEAARALMGA